MGTPQSLFGLGRLQMHMVKKLYEAFCGSRETCVKCQVLKRRESVK